MRKNLSKKLRSVMGVMMMACMLLAVVSVSSNADAGITVCGETLESEKDELNQRDVEIRIDNVLYGCSNFF